MFLSKVRGIKGVFLANQKVDGKVTTLITYNKGRDWEPLAPPTIDMNGKAVTCKSVRNPLTPVLLVVPCRTLEHQSSTVRKMTVSHF